MERTLRLQNTVRREIKLKDPFSSLSHLIFAVISLFAGIPLIVRGFGLAGRLNGASMILFIIGLVGLYTASGIYHALDISPAVNKRLRKLDHSMIYVLIAGTYSPICLNVLKSPKGLIMFITIWALAAAGILLALMWINCPKWLSAVIYILMGWTCVFAFTDLLELLERGAFIWLLVGGIIYTVGGVIYALKLPLFNKLIKGFGNHELFHLFCIGGSFCHYMVMLLYVAA